MVWSAPTISTTVNLKLICLTERHLTLAILLKELKALQVPYHGSAESLRKLLYKLGFDFVMDDGKRFLINQPRTTLKRQHFLREFYTNYSSPQRLYEVYQDETWTFLRGSGMKPRSWVNDDPRSFRRRYGASLGKRFLISHTGGAEGFLPGAALMETSSSLDRDYHKDMNGARFKRHFQEDIIANLYKPSLIIIDNASYHNVQQYDDNTNEVKGMSSKEVRSELQPSSSWNKDAIRSWLTQNGVPFHEHMNKVELLSLAKIHRVEPVYVLDNLLEGTPHRILRLPPYHSHWNPIELVWGIAKRYYDAHVDQGALQNEANARRFWEEALATITPAVWANCCRHTENLILEAYHTEVTGDSEFRVEFGEDGEDSDSEIDGDLKPAEDVLDHNVLDHNQGRDDTTFSIISGIVKLPEPPTSPPKSTPTEVVESLACLWGIIPSRKIYQEEIDLAISAIAGNDGDRPPPDLIQQLRNHKPHQVVVTKFKISLTAETLLLVWDGKWLNDEIINFYLCMIMERWEHVYSFNTFFFGKLSGPYKNVERWTKSVSNQFQ
ncbi:Sentrin-specific protease 1 [Frankliniella fusca]|uniref:Sentrin-specific protease 1 n=1 Tax=Frankliniella fusca TaxID=407009 RepID=A0AAE1GSV8_9NEOP|nr:Sentrin-specific protease 1 [Frankliniella fusca]